MTTQRLLLTIMLCNIPALGAETARKPNILFIIADDFGYMDVASYAARVRGVKRTDTFYETPNIDALADRGMSFTQAYACPVCSPTRASILTGRYAAREGFTVAAPANIPTYFNQKKAPPDGWRAHDMIIRPKPVNHALVNGTSTLGLDRDVTTLAEALGAYDSAFIGKWHLGAHGAEGHQPHDQGFTEIAYHDNGGLTYFNWRKPTEKRHAFHGGVMGVAGPDDTGKDYLTDDYTVRAVRWLRQRAKTPNRPFFLYLCHFAVHSPFEAKPEYVAHFEKKPTRGFNGHVNATYAAMVKSLDDSVGDLLATLDQTGLAANTAVFFMSDNGGLVAVKGKTAPVPITSNAPLRGGKSSHYEGGMRVPFIVSWPGHTRAGSLCDVPVDCTDIFPTLMEMSDTDYTAYRLDGHSDGQSLLPLLADPQNRNRAYTKDTRFWHNPFYTNYADGLKPPRSTIRKGDWKLIFFHHGYIELYHLATDRSETNNLAGKNPAKTRELFAALCHWLDTRVDKRYLPTRNPRYKPEVESPYPPYRDIRAETLGR